MLDEFEYDPQHFLSAFENPTGRAILEFLTQPNNIIRMETATYLSKPAIEPMSPFLEERFAAAVEVDRIKRMMGHMVRQIMEYRGYPIDERDVPITSKGNIFSTAARYTRK